MTEPIELRESCRDKTARTAGWVTIAGGAGMVAFWALLFGGLVDVGPEGSLVHAFEMAFPIADALLAALLFLAGVSLLKGRSFGAFWLVAAAGITLYLGVLDVTFYARQGLYAGGSGLFELAVNAACVGGGLFGLRYGWKLWSAAHTRPAAVTPWPATSHGGRRRERPRRLEVA
jgi:hypothetical protein